MIAEIATENNCENRSKSSHLDAKKATIGNYCYCEADIKSQEINERKRKEKENENDARCFIQQQAFDYLEKAKNWQHLQY